MWLKSKFPCAAVFLILLMVPGCSTHSGEIKYFPAWIFGGLAEWDRDVPIRFAKILKSAGERAIYEEGNSPFVVRLVFSSSFFGGVVVRIEESFSGAHKAYVTKFYPGADSDIGKIEYRRSFEISAEQFRRIGIAIEHSDFWSNTSYQDIVASDGDGWVIEVNQAGKYHAVYELYPTDGEIYEIGTEILRAGKLTLEQFRIEAEL